MCYPPAIFECIVEKISTLPVGFYELEEPFGYLHINGNDIYWYEMKYSSDIYPLKLPISDKLIKKASMWDWILILSRFYSKYRDYTNKGYVNLYLKFVKID